MAESGAGREQVTPVAGVHGIHIPPQAPPRGFACRGLAAGEFGDRGGREDPLTAIQNHLTELRQVRGGGEQAGVSGHTAHEAGRGVVHHATQDGTVLLRFRGSDPGRERGCREVGGVLHAQGFKQDASNVFVFRLAGHLMDDFAEEHEIDIAVDKLGTEGIDGFIQQSPPDSGFIAGPLRLEVEIGPQPGVMRHQIADRDVASPALESGEITGDGGVDGNFPFGDELHHGGGRRHNLG